MASENQSFFKEGNIISERQVLEISTETFDALANFLNCFLIHVMCLFGIVGNILTIIILLYNGFKVATNVALFVLAVSDLFFSVTQSLIKIPSLIYLFNFELAYNVLSYLLANIYMWNQCAVTISIDIVAVITLERFIAVWLPFKVSRLISPNRMICIIAAVLTITIPQYILESLTMCVTQINIGNNITITYYTNTLFYRNNITFFEMFRKFFKLTVNAGIPTVFIIVCSVMIIFKLTLSSRNLKKMSVSASEKRTKDLRSIKTTLSLCFCLVFFVLIPSNGYDLYISYTDNLSIGKRLLSLILFFFTNNLSVKCFYKLFNIRHFQC
ncbi:probable G-protein coupled receptor B0563.6 [Physella acuta]|uniref:probable G-protein coupled receptor B0563.6 n=1 Tax=Physella acuta TaxID=109671 RepID=UPI0027DE99A8|nr:probable G-protein coupled receptor B0563.6 [Physella acuta]